MAGLDLASASYRLASPTDLITDVTLVHPFDTRHQLNEDSLADAEARKNRSYKADYRALGLAFAPLACNSFGQQGPDLLRYLWPGSLLIVMRSANAQASCPRLSFLSLILSALPLPLILLSRPVGPAFIVSRYMRS